VSGKPDYDALLQAARDVRKNSYSPYSGFAVGAALLDAQGRVHCGVNMENASYPVGVCAERSALCIAISAGAREFVAMALVTAAPVPVGPCGMCRQALAEFGDFELILAAPEGEPTHTTVGALLPAQFDPSHLEGVQGGDAS
jgi:cytidine deaminase